MIFKLSNAYLKQEFKTCNLQQLIEVSKINEEGS